MGEYDDGTPMAEGFCENAAFFDLVYVDPDAIDVAGELDEILPALWLAAGCHGNPGDLEHDQAWLLSSSSRFAVLLDEDRFRAFRNELDKHPEITHVWLVTDSETAFARMRDELPGIPTVGRLYRDYLRNFRVTVDMCAGMHSRGTTSGSCATVTESACSGTAENLGCRWVLVELQVGRYGLWMGPDPPGAPQGIHKLGDPP